MRSTILITDVALADIQTGALRPLPAGIGLAIARFAAEVPDYADPRASASTPRASR